MSALSIYERCVRETQTGDTHAVERLAHKVVEWLEEWCGVVVVEDLYV